MKAQVMKFESDVDTDQIIGSQYLLLPNVETMKPYTFATLREDFVKEVAEKNILVAEENFGCGSSREQAPMVLKALGVQCIIAKSFGRIFFRNAINIGLSVVICQEAGRIEEGMTLEVDLEAGRIKVLDNEAYYECTQLPDKMQHILRAGGLLALLDKREEQN